MCVVCQISQNNEPVTIDYIATVKNNHFIEAYTLKNLCHHPMLTTQPCWKQGVKTINWWSMTGGIGHLKGKERRGSHTSGSRAQQGAVLNNQHYSTAEKARAGDVIPGDIQGEQLDRETVCVLLLLHRGYSAEPLHLAVVCQLHDSREEGAAERQKGCFCTNKYSKRYGLDAFPTRGSRAKYVFSWYLLS